MPVTLLAIAAVVAFAFSLGQEALQEKRAYGTMRRLMAPQFLSRRTKLLGALAALLVLLAVRAA
ncbi:MAG: hypothetical protein AAF763_13180 [Pseudomonadota bacterium]